MEGYLASTVSSAMEAPDEAEVWVSEHYPARNQTAVPRRLSRRAEDQRAVVQAVDREAALVVAAEEELLLGETREARVAEMQAAQTTMPAGV